MEQWIYCAKGFCDADKGENLVWAYKRRKNAEKRFDKLVKSMCYEKVALTLQNAVFIAETELVLKEYRVKKENA